MQMSHRHHYVPKWYQKRFMLQGQTSYYRLDLFPEQIKTPNGKIIKKAEILYKGVDKFFYEINLNTTKYFDIENDDIEKYLFGEIDAKGTQAIDSMASPNWKRRIHNHILNYYEYMDAQRLRTPKGLAWIKQILHAKDHNDVLYKMQTIRQMHCTMWAEASMEIVSAENSYVKFIVSDNPVTLYNSSFYPKSKQCLFPFDPGIELKGTRTIFPLDLNHCAILTNLEYARSPIKATEPRTNPRFFDDTIIKYDDIIRERYLDKQQVLAINYILKTRAHRYIAAAEKEWLYPERFLKRKDWRGLDKVFISEAKNFNLLGRGGEIFVGGNDGKLIVTQDEYGRKPKSQKEWDEKERHAQEMHEHLIKLLKKEKYIKVID